jgi:MYXO-CTERM domain-containing protein
VSAGDVVTLDGTGSSDPEGATLTFAWVVDSGPAVSLADAHAASTSFTAPAVTTPTDLVVRLTVADPQGANGTATVVITVNPVTNPAQGCSCATGSGSDALGLLLALGLVLSRRRASGR